MTADPLDEKSVSDLAQAIIGCLRDHYETRMRALDGPNYCITLETLNALAISVAVLLAGTGWDPDAVAFFDNALETQPRAQIAEAAAALARRCGQ